MFADSATRPWLDACECLEARILAHEIEDQLVPHDQLAGKRIPIASRRRRALNRERHGIRSNLAEG